MAGPWEKYQTAPAPAVAGPWSKYQAAPVAEPPVVDSYAPPATVPVRDPMNPDAPPAMAAPTFTAPGQPRTAAEVIQLASQAGLRGAADLAGSVYDLPNAAFMGTQWLMNEGDQLLTGAEDVPVIGLAEMIHRQLGGDVSGAGFNLGDTIANAASTVDSYIPPIPNHERVPPMTREDMGNAEGLYDPIRFGVGAALGGIGLNQLAKPAAERLATAGQKAVGDGLLRPYMDRPVAAIARDAGSGVGAAVAQDKAEDNEANPFLQVLATVGGGVAGHGLVAGAQGAKGGIINAGAKTRAADQAVPVDPDTRVPFRQGEANLAAAEIQRRTGDRLPVARSTFDQNLADLDAAGVPRDAMPTFGLMSEDPGLIQQERGFRTSDEMGDFVQRDQNIKDYAADQVGGLRNPNADMNAVSASLDATERSYKMTREAEALPLLQQATQAGVTVDASPVAALIDQKLATAKRPPVKKALTEARGFLNETGGDNLDTSVSGLYEARKAINDVIEGRGENPTGRFAQGELIEVRNALDEAITQAAPEFGQYLQKFREGSEPIDAFKAPVVEAARGPTNARRIARDILSDDIDGAEQVRQIKDLISGDPGAEEALRAAFAEEAARKITTSAEAGDENFEVSLAALSKEFKAKQSIYAEVFPPEDMQTLQQVNTLLGYFRGLSKKATPGSDTASLLREVDLGDTVLGKAGQLAIRHVYGDLKGGGIVRRYKLMASLLPTSKVGAQKIAYMAQFNPELGRYLLGLPVRNVKAIPNNFGLRAAIAADIANEGDNAPEEE